MLTVKVGKESAGDIISYIEEKIRDEFGNRSTWLATKEDLANIKSETIKWMFALWIGQIATTFGIIMHFLKR